MHMYTHKEKKKKVRQYHKTMVFCGLTAALMSLMDPRLGTTAPYTVGDAVGSLYHPQNESNIRICVRSHGNENTPWRQPWTTVSYSGIWVTTTVFVVGIGNGTERNTNGSNLIETRPQLSTGQIIVDLSWPVNVSTMNDCKQGKLNISDRCRAHKLNKFKIQNQLTLFRSLYVSQASRDTIASARPFDSTS